MKKGRILFFHPLSSVVEHKAMSQVRFLEGIFPKQKRMRGGGDAEEAG